MLVEGLKRCIAESGATPEAVARAAGMDASALAAALEGAAPLGADEYVAICDFLGIAYGAPARPQNKRKPELDLRAVGRRVAELRRSAGLSRRELAWRAGLPEAAVAALEAGAWEPTFVKTCLIAETLGVSVDELVGLEAPQARGAGTQGNCTSAPRQAWPRGVRAHAEPAWA